MFQVFTHYVWLKVLIEGKIWHLDIPEEVLDLLAALDKLTQTQRQIEQLTHVSHSRAKPLQQSVQKQREPGSTTIMSNAHTKGS